MIRRQVLGVLTTATGIGLGGCTMSDRPPEVVDVTRSQQTKHPATAPDRDQTPWGRYMASEESARTLFDVATDDSSDAVATFIENTSFDAGNRLVYVLAYGPQTCYELTIDATPTIGPQDTLRIDTQVHRTAPSTQPCGDAITLVDLLVRIRITPDTATVPTAQVTVARPNASPAVLELQAE